MIDNKPGAGGNVGADVVAKSPPDGYTILLHTSAHASAGPLYKSLPFDPVKDFAPVTMVIATQTIVCGSFKNPATTCGRVIAEAKAKPGSLNYASSGPGSSLHLYAELLKVSAGVDIVHIPYRGDAPMITAMSPATFSSRSCRRRPGLRRSRASRYAAARRSPAASGDAIARRADVQEQGVAGIEEGSWNGMWMPAGTPPDIVLALQQSMAKALADPQVRDRLLSVGQEPVGNTPPSSRRCSRPISPATPRSSSRRKSRSSIEESFPRRSRRSLRLDAGVLDHLGPFGDLGRR